MQCLSAGLPLPFPTIGDTEFVVAAVCRLLLIAEEQELKALLPLCCWNPRPVMLAEVISEHLAFAECRTSYPRLYSS